MVLGLSAGDSVDIVTRLIGQWLSDWPSLAPLRWNSVPASSGHL
jgi:hypothetical protein